MLRTLTLTAVTALGLLVPLAVAPPAEAHTPFETLFRPHHQHRFHVLYRPCGCRTWECYGTYRCFEDADRVACRLRSRGFEVRIRN